MRLVAASKEYLLAGVRCATCGRFALVGEGNGVPVCYCAGTPQPSPQTLEHHLWGCIEACGRDCSCLCHEYRPREGKAVASG